MTDEHQLRGRAPDDPADEQELTATDAIMRATRARMTPEQRDAFAAAEARLASGEDPPLTQAEAVRLARGPGHQFRAVSPESIHDRCAHCGLVVPPYWAAYAQPCPGADEHDARRASVDGPAEAWECEWADEADRRVEDLVSGAVEPVAGEDVRRSAIRRINRRRAGTRGRRGVPRCPQAAKVIGKAKDRPAPAPPEWGGAVSAVVRVGNVWYAIAQDEPPEYCTPIAYCPWCGVRL